MGSRGAEQGAAVASEQELRGRAPRSTEAEGRGCEARL